MKFFSSPHVIRTGNPYPVSPELVAQKEAEAAEAIADAIKPSEYRYQSQHLI